MPVKCNESLREDYCRWFTTRERNCEGNVWAQRYGMAHLFHSLKDLYQGEIVITGEPAMKPYDQCFMYDSYNDMHGVFEVEQVTHIFSSRRPGSSPASSRIWWCSATSWPRWP